MKVSEKNPPKISFFFWKTDWQIVRLVLRVKPCHIKSGCRLPCRSCSNELVAIATYRQHSTTQTYRPSGMDVVASVPKSCSSLWDWSNECWLWKWKINTTRGLNKGRKEKDELQRSYTNQMFLILINVSVWNVYKKVLWITMLGCFRINDMTFEEPGCDFQCIYDH